MFITKHWLACQADVTGTPTDFYNETFISHNINIRFLLQMSISRYFYLIQDGADNKY